MKQTFRYDLHVHTFEGSACARTPAAELADFYKSEGYAGIVVSDHFWAGNTRVPRDLPWEEWIERFKDGWRHAKARGDEIGLDVFYAWEYSYAGTDFLTFGLDNDWLLEHPDVRRMDVRAYLDLVRASGGYVIHAHPFHEAGYIPYIRLLPHHVDAVEVINAPKPDFANERAREYARAYGLTMTAGSDCHGAGWQRLAGIETETRLSSMAELIDTLKAGTYSLFRYERA